MTGVRLVHGVGVQVGFFEKVAKIRPEQWEWSALWRAGCKTSHCQVPLLPSAPNACPQSSARWRLLGSLQTPVFCLAVTAAPTALSLPVCFPFPPTRPELPGGQGHMSRESHYLSHLAYKLGLTVKSVNWKLDSIKQVVIVTRFF